MSTPAFKQVKVPAGDRITIKDGKLSVPNNPILPFIEGDGTGPDIWRSSVRVMDAAVEKAYGGKKKISWMEVYAGEKSFTQFGSWLHEDTVPAFEHFLVGIKGPLTTPVGGGIRSLNVALRQLLDLYVCLRPVRWFKGVPSPVKRPQDCDMVIFRENTEDIYAGIEYLAGSKESAALLEFLKTNDPKNFAKVRFGSKEKTSEWKKAVAGVGPEIDEELLVGIGLKPVSKQGSQRLIYAAIEYALKEKKKSVTLVHKGNIMKFTEGAFKDWGYELSTTFKDFRNKVVTERESWILGNKDAKADLSDVDNAKAIDPGYDMMSPAQQKAIVDEVAQVLKLFPTHGGGKWKGMLLVRDSIADITLQQILTRPKDFDVVATMNLNGDYLSDALAAQIGGIGIAPGANINYVTGHAIFEATHGTAPKYANLDQVNPGSVILSGEMMLRYMGWTEAADLIIKGMDGAIGARTVTYDFHRQMVLEGHNDAKKLKCSEFGDAIIKHM